MVRGEEAKYTHWLTPVYTTPAGGTARAPASCSGGVRWRRRIPAPPKAVKDAVAQQFGAVAEHYRTSAVHAGGEDLAQLVAAANLHGHEAVLDVGSGAGHTALALAPGVAHVTVVDLAVEMLARARWLAQERGLANLTFQSGDVEALDFPDGCFDLVASRYSAGITGRIRSGRWASFAVCCVLAGACVI